MLTVDQCARSRGMRSPFGSAARSRAAHVCVVAGSALAAVLRGVGSKVCASSSEKNYTHELRTADPTELSGRGDRSVVDEHAAFSENEVGVVQRPVDGSPVECLGRDRVEAGGMQVGRGPHLGARRTTEPQRRQPLGQDRRSTLVGRTVIEPGTEPGGTRRPVPLQQLRSAFAIGEALEADGRRRASCGLPADCRIARRPERPLTVLHPTTTIIMQSLRPAGP